MGTVKWDMVNPEMVMIEPKTEVKQVTQKNLLITKQYAERTQIHYRY